MLADTFGRPLRFRITPGQASDIASAPGLLEGQRGSHTAVLCGRNSVQLSFPDRPQISLEQLASKLAGVGKVTRNPFLLRLAVGEYNVTVFPDGRAIIAGTEDISEAKTVYAKYIGA